MIPRLRIWSFFETILRASVVDLNLGMGCLGFRAPLPTGRYEAFRRHGVASIALGGSVGLFALMLRVDFVIRHRRYPGP